MARRSLLGSLFTVTAAAAAVAGVAYLFKEEIRETQTYKDLNEKYDVDNKIKTYSEKAKETAYDLKYKAKDATRDLKTKVDEWKATNDDNIFEDDEIIIDYDEPSEDRNYTTIKEDVKDKAEEVKDNVADAADKAKDNIAEAADKAKDNIAEAADKAKDNVADAMDKVKEDIKDAAENIEID
ncbi:MAG: hypothetical protein K6E10_02750 [Eubacterium sp.]|nr:hypothetical protein [Eubacterium sp.]